MRWELCCHCITQQYQEQVNSVSEGLAMWESDLETNHQETE